MAETILVTGSSSGFGRLTVETLAREHYTVFAGMRAMSSRNRSAAEELETLAKQENLALYPIELDVTDDDSVNRAIQDIIAHSGRLDVVINNAGVSYAGPIEAFSIEQVQRIFDTNVFGAMRVNRAAIPQMRAQHSGLLLQIGSVTGRMGVPFLGLYGATKFTLEGLTESYRYELAPFGIDSAIIEPGAYPTELGAKRQTPTDTERATLYGATPGTALPRILGAARLTANPQEVIDAIAALIATPAGERPVRTLVSPTEEQRKPIARINAAADQATHEFYEDIGLLPTFTLK